MTRAWAWTAMTVVAMVALATAASAQLMGGPAPEGTLTVTVSGTAAVAPDWVDINLPISAGGASAEAALMAAQDARERTVAALLKAEVKQEQIKTTMTQIAATTPQPWEQPAGGPGMRFSASSTVRVRIPPETDGLYEAICGVLDAAAAANAGTAPGAPGGVNVMVLMRGGAGNSVVFGVNDRSALTAKAIGNALEEAKKVAEQAATLAGKTLGDLLALQVLPPSQAGPMAVMDMLGGLTEDADNNGKAVVSATVSATYRLK